MLRIHNDADRPFNVRVVLPGMKYGRDDCLTYPNGSAEKRVADAGDVLVEFYDAAQDPAKFGPRGQFVSRYYLSALRKGVGRLSLAGGVAAWQISAANVKAAVEYADRVLEEAD